MAPTREGIRYGVVLVVLTGYGPRNRCRKSRNAEDTQELPRYQEYLQVTTGIRAILQTYQTGHVDSSGRLLQIPREPCQCLYLTQALS